MKQPIDGIQAFVSIAELGSFQKAADRLSVTQTGLSRRLQRLEAYVGLRLLDRTTRKVTLTKIGAEFLPLARRLVDDLTAGLDQLRTTSRLAVGEVTVATLQLIAFRQLPRALKSYGRRYPDNRVQLIERSGSAVTEMVRRGEADFGIHIHLDDLPDLDQDQLMRDPFVLICGRRHPFAKKRSLRWPDLKGIDLITLGGTSGNRRVVEMHLEAAELGPRGRFVVESTPTALALCAGDVAAAILPAASSATHNVQRLVEVPLVDPVVARTISLVRRRNESLSPAAAALYAIIKSDLATLDPVRPSRR